MTSCQEKNVNQEKDLTLEKYSNIRDNSFVINPSDIHSRINDLVSADKSNSNTDSYIRNYYTNKGKFLWINRNGVDNKADTLLSYLNDVEIFGFAKEKFNVSKLKKDLGLIRALQFEDTNINDLFANIEYGLSKVYLKYVTGQRFGFLSPNTLFNRLDIRKKDSLYTSYRTLFDIPMESVNKSFYSIALRKIENDSICEFLHSVQPQRTLYQQLCERLKSATSETDKLKIMCNIERCRWRLHDYPNNYKKYIIVNIPAFHLYAVDGNNKLTMRVGCGTLDTKTPLLTSKINRMDINPRWVVPKSIIEKSMIHHVGDSSYFARHNYFMIERRTGKRVSMTRSAHEMMNNSKYYIIQEGGEGNSLGRIIFRFTNNFSVFLHDTSSPSVFSRDNRGVSHGCVRVEKPFDLAVFLLEEKDNEIIDKIQYSMTIDVNELYKPTKPKTDAKKIDRSRIVRSLSVTPQIPLFITYFTLYPNENGDITEYPDVYGYDKVMFDMLRKYI